MRPFILTALILMASPAMAGETLSGSYLCIREEAAGLAYNTISKHWVSTTFVAKDRFVLGLKLVDLDLQHEQDAVREYSVQITPVGTSNPEACIPQKSGLSLHLSRDAPSFECTGLTSIVDYTFNLKTLRYLSSYIYGYVSGDDTNAQTPFVAGGTCTKID